MQTWEIDWSCATCGWRDYLASRHPPDLPASMMALCTSVPFSFSLLNDGKTVCGRPNEGSMNRLHNKVSLPQQKEAIVLVVCHDGLCDSYWEAFSIEYLPFFTQVVTKRVHASSPAASRSGERKNEKKTDSRQYFACDGWWKPFSSLSRALPSYQNDKKCKTPMCDMRLKESRVPWSSSFIPPLFTTLHVSYHETFPHVRPSARSIPDARKCLQTIYTSSYPN